MDVRGNVTLNPDFLEQYLSKIQRKASAIEMSRRRFLLGSLALGGVSTSLLASEERVRFITLENSLVVLLNDAPRWVIAAERFGGAARLRVVRQTSDELELRLLDARLPGTEVAANLVCYFRRALGRWQFDLTVGDLGTVRSVDLVRWLAGEVVHFQSVGISFFPAPSPVRLVARRGHVSLDAMWRFEFEGADAEFEGVRRPLTISNLKLRLAPAGHRPELLGGRRPASLLTLERGTKDWGTRLFELLHRNGCLLNGPSELFQSIEMEACDCGHLPEISAVFASGSEPQHALQIPGEFEDRSGKPFELSLANPIYAMTTDGAGTVRAAFTSPLREQHVAVLPSSALIFDKPVSLQTHAPLSAAAARKPEKPPDPAEDQELLDLGLSQLVFGQHYEDRDTIFEFFVPTGKDLDLWWFGSRPFPPFAWVRALWDALFFRHEVVPLYGILMRVTRPRDFLSLHFTFANMALHIREGKPWLIRAPNAKGKPVLTAHFYPQHMQEETFQENSNGGSDQGAPSKPVDMTLSGPTRLSFNLDINERGERLTVDKLLEWKAGRLRQHDDNSELAGDTGGLHGTSNTVFELPYRLQMDTAELSTSLSLLQQPKESPRSNDTPELWHVALEPQLAMIDSAVRTAAPTQNVTITFKPMPTSTKWRMGDTFTVLDPPEFAGTFVLDSATANSVIYTQPVPGPTPLPPLPGAPAPPPAPVTSRKSFTMSLANRFVAYRALDKQPVIKTVTSAAGVATMQFQEPTGLQAGDVINISASRSLSICTDAPGPGTVVVLSVDATRSTVTFQLPPQSPPPARTLTLDEQCSVSILTYSKILSVVGDADGKTTHVTTDLPHGQRVGDKPFLLDTGIKLLDGQAYPVTASDNVYTFKIISNVALPVGVASRQGRMVATRMYPLTSNDRTQVSDLSKLQPLSMEQLILSALGAWASMEGNFQPDTGKNQIVTRFIYRFAQRRDYYVEVDYEGFLWPFGHRAVLLKITQRFFYNSQNPVALPALVENAAYLRTRFFVVVKQKTRNYIAAGQQGLQLPFARIDFVTDCTPPLYAVPLAAGVAGAADSACSPWFWPSIGQSAPVLFKLRGYDDANPANQVDFVAPLIFVNGKVGTAPDATLTQAMAEYSSRTFAPSSTTLRCHVLFGGAPLHFATSATPGDTELHVTSIDFSGKVLDPGQLYPNPQSPASYTVPGDVDPGITADLGRAAIPASKPVAFRPTMQSAQVDIPSVSTFSGQPAQPAPPPVPPAPGAPKPRTSSQAKPVTVTYNDQFLKTGFNQVAMGSTLQHPNPMEIYVDVSGGDSASLSFPGATSGGLAKPSAPIKAMARHTGPVGSPRDATWDPTDPTAKPPSLNPMSAFDQLGNAKLLGCIPIGEAIEVILDLSGNLNLAPSLNLQKVYDAIDTVEQDFIAFQKTITDAQTKLHNFNQGVQTAIQGYADDLKSTLSDTVRSAVGTVSSTVDTPIANLSTMYDRQAKALKRQMAAMEQAAQQQAPNVQIPQDTWDSLRAAADIDLNSYMTQRVVALIGAESDNLTNAGTVAVCTLDDLHKKLRALITAAVRPLDPSRLPTQAVATALENLVGCFDVSKGIPQPANIRDKGLALLKALKNFARVVLAAPGQVQFNQHLLNSYLTQTKRQLVTDAQAALATAKSTALSAVHDHHTAFLPLYKTFNQTYCNNALPATPTYASAVAETQAYLNAATIFAEDQLAAMIDKQLGDLAANILPAVSPVIDQLNQALVAFNDVISLCNEVVDALSTPVSVSATYTLAKIPMKDAPSGDPIFMAHRIGNQGVLKAVLEIDATVSASLRPLKPTDATASASTEVKLSDFSVQLLPGAPFITVQFQSFEFTAGTGQGTHSQCTLDPDTPVILGDALAFVEDLVQAFLPMGGGGGPVISLFGSGIGVGYNFKLPQIQAGGFQISGLSFEALLLLSFEGDPLKLRFYLATPQKHFLMSAGIFGGGGFFGLELSSQGVDLVQGCMEFGAVAALDLGVASGEVHILGGFYFEFGDRRCLLTGFVRAGGSLNILGIVEMSVEFYIGLTYQKVNDQTSVYGTCTVTVSISILFFSADVSLSMEWQWAGSKSQATSVSLNNDTSRPLYAMLETKPNPFDKADESAEYGEHGPVLSDWPRPKTNARLDGLTEQIWETYTAAFMKE